MLRSCLLFYILCNVLCISLHKKDESLFITRNAYKFPATVEDDSGSQLSDWSDVASQFFEKDGEKILNGWRDTRELSAALKINEHLASMGHPNKCDDGQTNLDVDWDGSPIEHTCYQPKEPLPVNKEIQPVYECDKIPKGYLPKHVCMDKEIQYSSFIPTHEMHRPLWAVFGEYVYVPPQRWLHNVEHGSIVMLYHPCAEPAIVEELKMLVKGCIRKHIITADTSLHTKMPLALVGWGCRLLMNTVDIPTVVKFIKDHGLTGPEGWLSKEGQYNLTLIEKSQIPAGSNFRDSKLCPAYS